MIDLTPPNDWPLPKLLLAALITSTGSLVFASLSWAGVPVLLLSSIFGFVFITFVPGLLLLRILRIHGTGYANCLAYAVGLSLACTMFGLAAVNIALPLIGISKPMSILPVAATLSIVTIILMAAAWLRDRDFAGSFQPIPVRSMPLPQVLSLVMLLALTILANALINVSGNNMLLLAVILCLAAVILLAAYGRFLHPDVYPFALFILGLCLLYQTTLLSPYLVGSDINVEYAFYQAVSQKGYWDYSVPSTVNSCLSITMLAPAYSLMMAIPGIWVFKAVYPLVFALVPVMLYQVFKGLAGRRKAFLSAVFFIIVPTFSLEMIALCRQQVAELFLVLLIMMLVDTGLPAKTRAGMGSIFAVSIAVSHYATGFIIFIYLGLLIPFMLLLNLTWVRAAWDWLSAKTGGLPERLDFSGFKPVLVIVSCYFICGLTWYILIGSGVNWNLISSLWLRHGGDIASVLTSPSSTPSFSFLDFSSRDKLVVTALGLDFFQSSLQGQIFRFFQLFTQFLIILGFFRVVFRPKGLSLTAGYLALCVTGFLLLAACILVPGFADNLNATRIYHIALITLAPFCVLGGAALWQMLAGLCCSLRKPGSVPTNPGRPSGGQFMQFMAAAVLVPYFIFTSGFIFEVTGQKTTDRIDTPYSIALSSYRLDLTGVFTLRDGLAASWLAKHTDNSSICYTDQHSFRVLQLQGFIGSVYYVPLEGDIPWPPVYLYLTQWNYDHGEMTFFQYPGITRGYYGLRRAIPFSEIPGFMDALESMNMIYINGGARVLALRPPMFGFIGYY